MPATNFVTGDNPDSYRDAAPIKIVPPSLAALARGRRDTPNAQVNLYLDGKNHAIPSSPPGQIPSEEPGLVAGWLHRVTFTTSTARRLGVIPPYRFDFQLNPQDNDSTNLTVSRYSRQQEIITIKF